MIRKIWNDTIFRAKTLRLEFRPVGREMKFFVLVCKPVNVMGLIKLRLAVNPMYAFKLSQGTPTGVLLSLIDYLTSGHVKSPMFRSQPVGKLIDNFVI